MGAESSELIETYSSHVLESQIDELGHMNVRWYAHNAFQATASMLARLDLVHAPVVSAYTRHHHEQLIGNELVVHSAVVADNQRLRLYHELRNTADGDLAATFVHEIGHAPIEYPAIELPPHGQPRSIRLDTAAVTTAPTLDEVTADGLAIRLPRPIDEEDTQGGDVVPTWNTPSMFWGGEPLDGRSSWLRTGPTGQTISSATMESRFWVREVPTIGTQIQSFGAPVELLEKVSRHVHWAFNLETGSLLGVMETVHIVFDLDARRAIAIPEDERAETAARLRPELAPR